jgi:Ni,Fe-hydrogenase maturation factor
MKKMLLGEILIQDGAITQMQLEEAIEYQKKNQGLIGIILIQLGYVTEKQLHRALIKQTQQTTNTARNITQEIIDETVRKPDGKIIE